MWLTAAWIACNLRVAGIRRDAKLLSVPSLPTVIDMPSILEAFTSSGAPMLGDLCPVSFDLYSC